MVPFELRTLAVAQLLPAPYNPRRIPSRKSPAYRKLKGSLKEFGLVEPADPAESDAASAAPAPDIPALPDSPAGPAKWFYLDRDKEIGPVAEEVILHRISAGHDHVTKSASEAKAREAITSYGPGRLSTLACSPRRFGN